MKRSRRAEHGRAVATVGVALTLAVVAARALSLADRLERQSIDLRFAYAPRPAAPLHDAICFVDIDDGALEVGGRWPWPRDRLAAALREVARAGARTVALDLLLSEAERSGASDRTSGDVALAEAVAAAPTVVSIDLGDDDARAHARRTSHLLELQQRLRALARERGTLPDLATTLAALRPADASVTLSRRDGELIATLHAQERAWTQLASHFLVDERDGPLFAKAPLVELAAAARGAGFVNFAPDDDGALRVVAALRDARGGQALQLGLAAALTHRGLAVDAVSVGPDEIVLGDVHLPLEEGKLWLVWPTTREPGDAPAWLRCAPRCSLGRALDLAEAEVDLARQGVRQREFAAAIGAELGIAAAGDAQLAAVADEARFRVEEAAAAAAQEPLTADEEALLQPFRDYLAFERVREQARGDIDRARAHLAAMLRDKLVFIGWTATGAASDFVPTPLSPRTPGVMAHAVAADMVLSARALHFAPDASGPLLTLAIGLLATLASLPPLWLATLLGSALMTAYCAISGWLFAHQSLVVPLAAPVVAGALAWIGGVAVQAALARRDQQRITRQFKARVAPELVDYLVENPDALSMAGEPRDVTCFFVDLAGFTSLSEKLGAQQTVALLNRCMRATTEALTRHGAYVNKYLGDGLMAFWSAFRPDPEQATHACQGALAAQAALATVIDPKQVAARMGIASGRVIVGDCGAPPLLHDYTAIGDAINLAARLESANKQFGTKILLDGVTRRAVKDMTLRFRPCGRVVVVGQTTPVDLFELAPPELTEAEIEATARAVEAFARGERSEAEALFRGLAARFGESKLARVYLDALAEPTALDGILHLHSK